MFDKFNEVPGWFSWENQGADIALADLDHDGQSELIVFMIDNPDGLNKGGYKIGKQLDRYGNVTGAWTDWCYVPDWGSFENQGGGIAVADIDQDGQMDIIVFMIDNPGGLNQGKYKIGFGLDTEGKVKEWGSWILVPDWFSWENQHGSIAVGDINNDGRLELIVFMIDNPGGRNQGYFKIGSALDNAGNVTGGWSNWIPVPGWFAWENHGAGVALADMDNSGTKDIIIFQIDDAPQKNRAFYKIGKELDRDGQVASWGPWIDIPFWYSWENQGGGIAPVTIKDTTDLSNKTALMVFTVDNPPEINKGLFRQFFLDDRINYRDYLLQIWTGSPSRSEPYNKALTAINDKFKQNFETLNTTEEPALNIVIRILSKIVSSSANPSPSKKSGESDREFLNRLIVLTKLSSQQLRCSFLIDIDRSDIETTTEVDLSIATLQNFYRDGFQFTDNTFDLIPVKMRGYPPFFLHYEEWLQERISFFPENFYSPFSVQLYSNDTSDNDLKAMTEQDKLKIPLDEDSKRRRYLSFSKLQGALVKARNVYSKDDYNSAYILYTMVDFSFSVENCFREGFYRFNERVTSAQELCTWLVGYDYDADNLFLRSSRIYCFDIEACIAEIALKLGRYEEAITLYGQFTKWVIAKASLGDSSYQSLKPEAEASGIAQAGGSHDLLMDGDLPYSYCKQPSEKDRKWKVVDTYDSDYYSKHGYFTHQELDESSQDKSHIYRLGPYKTKTDTGIRLEFYLKARDDEILHVDIQPHPMFYDYCRLRQSNALLEWADSLYRTDKPADIQRARELYKSVLLVHGVPLPTDPSSIIFQQYASLENSWEGVATSYSANPAVVAQVLSAYSAFHQIEKGLNCYGYRRDFVPPLHFKPLWDAAERFIKAGVAAQRDFLGYMTKIETDTESAIRDEISLAGVIKKAGIQAQIADEQKAIATLGVVEAERKVTEVKQAIAAKRAEIEDHNSFFTQVSDFFSGMSDALGKGVPSFVGGKIQKEYDGKDSKLSDYAKVTSMSASAVFAGAGLFAYGTYASITSMSAAQDQRQAELDKYLNVSLPSALDAVEGKKREVNIADLQSRLANADAVLAQDLGAALKKFRDTRFLSIDTLYKLAGIMKRIMNRYVALGAKYSWLAERALAYEIDQPISIVKFDYSYKELQGVSGADILQYDLLQLDAFRLESIRRTLPIKRTYSLAYDFPLDFVQFKTTGRCTFLTQESLLQAAYPGCYGYRIRAVDVSVLYISGFSPLNGTLKNDGVSVITRANGTQHISVREPNVLPISEFRLADESQVFGLSDELLYIFEGSGFETFWKLECPVEANSGGLANLQDVLISFDLQADYSPLLYQQHIKISQQSKTIQKMVMVSALEHQTKALVELQNGASQVTFKFDMEAVGLPHTEFNRRIQNLVIFIVGDKLSAYKARLQVPTLSYNSNIAFKDGFAFSKAGSLAEAKSIPLPTNNIPLEKLDNQKVEQTFELTISKGDNLGVDLSNVTDIVFGVEYKADFSADRKDPNKVGYMN